MLVLSVADPVSRYYDRTIEGDTVNASTPALVAAQARWETEALAAIKVAAAKPPAGKEPAAKPPVAKTPTAPAPMTSTFAGGIRPAAVIWPVKNRPKCWAASTTAR